MGAFPRRSGVPHRPLSRQGDGSESLGAAVCQFPLHHNWDHNTIDHVQITVAEEVGIEGRWGYFDRSGQLRDMVQNHLLQILTLVAMEPPTSLDADSVRNEKLKVLKALRPITRDTVDAKTVRGQYTAGFMKGGPVPGFC